MVLSLIYLSGYCGVHGRSLALAAGDELKALMLARSTRRRTASVKIGNEHWLVQGAQHDHHHPHRHHPFSIAASVLYSCPLIVHLSLHNLSSLPFAFLSGPFEVSVCAVFLLLFLLMPLLPLLPCNILTIRVNIFFLR